MNRGSTKSTSNTKGGRECMKRRSKKLMRRRRGGSKSIRRGRYTSRKSTSSMHTRRLRLSTSISISIKSMFVKFRGY
jgi:hypothetical protein